MGDGFAEELFDVWRASILTSDYGADLWLLKDREWSQLAPFERQAWEQVAQVASVKLRRRHADLIRIAAGKVEVANPIHADAMRWAAGVLESQD